MSQILNDGAKRNFSTGKAYSGRNAAFLDNFDDTFFMTFVQGRDLGLHLRKKSEGIPLILIDKRKATEDSKGYFYKRGFTVFGLSDWEINGEPVKEPEDGAPFPWFGTVPNAEQPAPAVCKTAEQKPIAATAASKVFKEPAAIVPPKGSPVNKRSDFLRNTSTFFTRENKVVVLFIRDGEAVFYNMPGSSMDRAKIAVIKTSAPDWTGAMSPKDAKAVIKDIDSFNCGLLKNKRIAFASDLDIIDVVTVTEGPEVPVSELRKVIHAAATDPIKPAFNGVYVAPDAIAASDSRRLSMVPFNSGVKDGAIIPLDLVKSATGSITISGDKAASITDFGYITMKLVDGQFPNYKQVIPDDLKTATIMSGSALDWKELKSITQAPSYKVVVTEEGTHVEEPDHNNNRLLRKVSDVTAPFRFGVNAEYMSQAVTAESTIHLLGPMTPIVVKTGDVVDVIMPIQIKERD